MIAQIIFNGQVIPIGGEVTQADINNITANISTLKTNITSLNTKITGATKNISNINNTINTMKTNFTNGCNLIVGTLINVGITPVNNTPSGITEGINMLVSGRHIIPDTLNSDEVVKWTGYISSPCRIKYIINANHKYIRDVLPYEPYRGVNLFNDGAATVAYLDSNIINANRNIFLHISPDIKAISIPYANAIMPTFQITGKAQTLIDYFIFNQCNNFQSAFSRYTNVSAIPKKLNTNTNANMCNTFDSSSFGNTLLDLSLWDVSKVTNMYHMFNNFSCTTLNLSNWNLIGCTNVAFMFNDAYTNLIMHNLKLPSSIVSFCRRSSTRLCTINKISGWDTHLLTYMHNCFQNAIFSDSSSLNMESWDTRNVIGMSNMFNNCKFLTNSYIDISSWNTANVISMDSIFAGFINLERIYYNPSTFILNSRLLGNNAFRGCTNLVGPGGAYNSSKINLNAETVARYFTPI